MLHTDHYTATSYAKYPCIRSQMACTTGTELYGIEIILVFIVMRLGEILLRVLLPPIHIIIR
jgi:hypothetical protein